MMTKSPPVSVVPGTDKASYKARYNAMAILDDLIRYETDGKTPVDGRRVIGTIRMEVQSAMQSEIERVATKRALNGVSSESYQGQAQIADLHKRLRELPNEESLAEITDRARRLLSLWNLTG